jgi:DNA-binding transcriptional MerR regulator
VPVSGSDFFEYVELQGGTGELITKSELMTAVRDGGYKLSERQLTFYVSEGLIPQSVRAGSRAGVYPAIVQELMIWILHMRKAGASIDALRELLPVWKFLIKSRREQVLDIAEFEIVARQHLTRSEALLAVPMVVARVMLEICRPNCAPTSDSIMLVDKNRDQKPITDPQATIGFAIARPLSEDDPDGEHPASREWRARTRITLAAPASPNTDPTTVRLGRKIGELMPGEEQLAARTSQ